MSDATNREMELQAEVDRLLGVLTRKLKAEEEAKAWLWHRDNWKDPGAPIVSELLGVAQSYQKRAHALALELSRLVEPGEEIPESHDELDAEEWWGATEDILEQARKSRDGDE